MSVMPRLIDHDERRAEIAAALGRIVLREGPSGISIRDVATEAGLSAGSLRHVFADKAELLEFSMRNIYQQVSIRVRGRQRIRDPLRRAQAILAELLPLDDERRIEMHVNLALVSESVSHPGVGAAALEAHIGLRLACRSVLADLATHGIVDDRLDLDQEATRLHAVIDGLAMHVLLAGADTPADAKSVLRQHLDSLRA